MINTIPCWYDFEAKKIDSYSGTFCSEVPIVTPEELYHHLLCKGEGWVVILTVGNYIQR